MINEIKTFEERKQEIIEKGRKTGFITYEELANELKGIELESEQLDDLYDAFVKNSKRVNYINSFIFGFLLVTLMPGSSALSPSLVEFQTLALYN